MPLWYDIDRPLILASQSPRRREILALMGMRFKVVPSEIGDEQSMLRMPELEASLRELALAKARDVARHHAAALVLGADTVVVCEGRVMGKPRDARDAGEMIGLLSGRTHRVVSAVALVCRDCRFERSTTAVTEVRFRAVEPEEIAEYLAGRDYADKAGAYAIQGAAMRFVDRIDGCYYNVVGLPVAAAIYLFKEYAARKDPSDGRHA